MASIFFGSSELLNIKKEILKNVGANNGGYRNRVYFLCSSCFRYVRTQTKIGGSFLDLREKLAPYAQEQGRIYGILPAFIMAVAMLETGYGKSTLCNEANNLFSIKGEYNGKSITLPTTEYVRGKPIKVNAKFRKYPSFRESCRDFCELIKNGVSWNHTVYSRAVIGVTDLEKACINFGKTPYMTDPAYSGKLLAVIKSQDLAKYDSTPTAPASTHQTQHYKSLVDFLKSNGKDSSFAARALLAKQNGIAHYQGTADQNTRLLKLLGGQ
jgi:hypothetical protein